MLSSAIFHYPWHPPYHQYLCCVLFFKQPTHSYLTCILPGQQNQDWTPLPQRSGSKQAPDTRSTILRMIWNNYNYNIIMIQLRIRKLTTKWHTFISLHNLYNLQNMYQNDILTYNLILEVIYIVKSKRTPKLLAFGSQL